MLLWERNATVGQGATTDEGNNRGFFGRLKQTFSGFGDSIKERFGGITDRFKETFNGFGENFKGLLGGFGENFKGVLGGFGKGLGSLFGGGGGLGSLFGGGGGLGSTFGRIAGSFFGGPIGAGIGGFLGGLLPFVNGGLVPDPRIARFASGGIVRDRLPALLEPGEFIMRRQAVNTLGLATLRDLNNINYSSNNNPAPRGDVTFNVINNVGPGIDIEQSSTVDEDDNRVLNAIVRLSSSRSPEFQAAVQGGQF